MEFVMLGLMAGILVMVTVAVINYYNADRNVLKSKK